MGKTSLWWEYNTPEWRASRSSGRKGEKNPNDEIDNMRVLEIGWRM
jgi:hypothetical protein